jgi:hypothetical protein
VKLAFLKKRLGPRIGKQPDEKIVNASLEEKLEEQLFGELIAAIAHKDVTRFREAIEALVLNCFEENTDADAA